MNFMKSQPSNASLFNILSEEMEHIESTSVLGRFPPAVLSCDLNSPGFYGHDYSGFSISSCVLGAEQSELLTSRETTGSNCC